MKDAIRIRANRAKAAQSNATERQRKELARRKAMGIALIERPLRFIGDKTNTVTVKDGKPVVEPSPRFIDAHRFASRGDGAMVRRIAYEVQHSLR